MGSGDEGEREWACSAVANMAGDPHALEILLGHNVLEHLLERLRDPQAEVQLAAAGALRNIAIAGGERACQEMLARDLPTPVLSLFSHAVGMVKALNGSSIPSLESLEKKGIISRFLEQLLIILLSLCEHFEKATEQLSQKDAFFTDLFELLNSNFVSKRGPIVAALQFLYTITEENASLSAKFSNNPVACRFLIDFVGLKAQDLSLEDSSLIRILAAGVLFNLSGPITAVLGRHVATVVVPVIGQTLKGDAPALLREFRLAYPLFFSQAEEDQEDQENLENLENLENQKKREEQQVGFSRIVSLLASQQVALELLTNICSDSDSDPNADWEEVMEEEEQEDGGKEEEEEEEEQQQQQQQEEEVQGMEEDQGQGHNDAVAIILNSHVLLQLVVEKTQLLPMETYQQLSQSGQGKGLLESFNQVQLRAIDCINNLAMVLSEGKGGAGGAGGAGGKNPPNSNPLQPWWDGLFALALAMLAAPAPSIDPLLLLDSITASCWSIARGRAITATAGQVEALGSGAKGSARESTRINCVGALGSLALSLLDPSLSEAIVLVLLHALNDSSLWVVLESLNALFDIFGDKDRNDIFQRLKIPHILLETKQKLQQMRKSVPKKDKELYARFDETLLNLKRFITYKKNEK